MAEQNELEYFDIETIFVPGEDGSEIECAIMDEFECDGKNYMVVAEITADGEVSEDDWIFRIEEEEGEDIFISSIEDEEEWAKVSAAWEAILAEEEDDEE